MNCMCDSVIIDHFKEVGAILTNDHFVYTSGMHGSCYVAKDKIYPHSRKLSYLCQLLAQKFSNYYIDVVIGPAIGAIPLTQWTSYHLSILTDNDLLNDKDVLAVFAEKNPHGDGFVFTRDYSELVKGKKILIVEDILTTGGSVKKIINLVKETGGEIIGVAALCNRGHVTAEKLGVNNLKYLAEFDFESYATDECPLCQQNIPINTRFGKGAEFLANKK